MSFDLRNLVLPFRRDRKRDFATGEGDALLASKVLQVLATSQGELPWRTAFGTPLQRLRHQANDIALAELGRIYIRDALRVWLPEARVVRVDAVRDGSALRLLVRFTAEPAAREQSLDLPLTP